MILSKQAIYTVQTTAFTVYCIIVRDQDQALLNPSTGKFVQVGDATAANSACLMTENAVAKGLYSKTDLPILKDGKYIVMVYKKVGGSYAPGTDPTLDKFYYFVKTELKLEFESTLGTLG
jgi:hypothetical protein